MIDSAVKQITIIQALQSKIKEKDMDIPENVHFNDGIIAAIEEVKKQYRLEQIERKQKRQERKEGITVDTTPQALSRRQTQSGQ
jgi:hypothetical protein